MTPGDEDGDLPTKYHIFDQLSVDQTNLTAFEKNCHLFTSKNHVFLPF
jgi:hypothetical protein